MSMGATILVLSVLGCFFGARKAGCGTAAALRSAGVLCVGVQAGVQSSVSSAAMRQRVKASVDLLKLTLTAKDAKVRRVRESLIRA